MARERLIAQTADGRTFHEFTEFGSASGLINSGAQKTKGPAFLLGLSGCKSLTMSYFHTGIRTIIGAEAFHCPVRDGKEWDHLAMVIRLDWMLPRQSSVATNS